MTETRIPYGGEKMTNIEAAFLTQLRQRNLPVGVAQYKPIPGRKIACDRVWEDRKLIVELEGGSWGKAKSRHTTGSGFAQDCLKYNMLSLLGWRVLRFTTDMVDSQFAADVMEQVLAGNNADLMRRFEDYGKKIRPKQKVKKAKPNDLEDYCNLILTSKHVRSGR